MFRRRGTETTPKRAMPSSRRAYARRGLRMRSARRPAQAPPAPRPAMKLATTVEIDHAALPNWRVRSFTHTTSYARAAAPERKNRQPARKTMSLTRIGLPHIPHIR